VFVDNVSRSLQTATGSRYRLVNYRGGRASSGEVLTLGDDWQVSLVDSTPDARSKWNSGTSTDSWIRDIKTFKYTVEDLNKNPLENARVIIKNSVGTELFNDLTDASGVVETEAYYRETTYDTAGVQTITRYDPFVITITKAGYESYYLAKDITARVDEVIPLKQLKSELNMSNYL